MTPCILQPVGEALIQKLLYLFNHKYSSGWALSDVSAVTLWWELCSRPAMMEKPPLRVSCFHSLRGNSSQFKETPSPRNPIVLNGSRPKAALLFPLFQPQRYQTLCDWIAWTPPGSPSHNPSPTSSCVLSLILLCQKSLAFPVPPSQEVAFLALDLQCGSKN